MKIAITNLDNHDRRDVRLYARDYCNRQANGHLGAEPIRGDIRAFFSLLRRYARKHNSLDQALYIIDAEFANMDDM